MKSRNLGLRLSAEDLATIYKNLLGLRKTKKVSAIRSALVKAARSRRKDGAREPVVQRRPSERMKFYHDGFSYYATYSRYPDGRLAEVFLTVDVKSGTAVESIARDAAILASRCFQNGVTQDSLRRSLTRLGTNEPAGPVCRFLDILAFQDERDKKEEREYDARLADCSSNEPSVDSAPGGPDGVSPPPPGPPPEDAPAPPV